jgi:hypothetical protein
MSEHKAGDNVTLGVIHNDGVSENLTILLGDKYEHYLSEGFSKSDLELLEVEPGDAFLGVEGMAQNTAGIDRIAGPLSPNQDYTLLQRSLLTPFHVLQVMILPFESQGVAMAPAEEAMLETDDGLMSSLLGKEGLLFLVNLLFWVMWVNILLGFTNLIPMVPFDGGHMFKDMVHAGLTRFRAVGRKLKLWNFHPMWIDHWSRKASSISSLLILFALLFTIFIPYF